MYHETVRRLLAETRQIRHTVNSSRRMSMPKVAELVRRTWDAQLALLSLRAERFGYTYDMDRARRGRS